MRTFFKAMLAALAVATVIAGTTPSAFAAGATSAVQGTVITVQPAQAAPTQRRSDFGYSGYGYYPSRPNVRTVVGTTLGGIVGAVLGRHSRSGQWLASAGGAAIGGVIGYSADQRAYERQIQAEQMHQAQRYLGVEVIVRLAQSGRTVAVFTHRSDFYPGQTVWLIGNEQLVPAS